MKVLALVTAVIVSMPVIAFAGDHTVIQKNKEFSQETITVKAGDSVTFKNEDDVAHNIYSKSDPKVFEIAKQEPGKSESVTFDKAGEVKIRCAIHPKMKITVTVQ